MRPFPHNDIALFIFYLTQHLAQVLNLHLKRVAGGLAFGNIDDTMNVEGDFLGRGRPVFVGEAVEVFAVGIGVKGVVAGGDGALVDEVVAFGVLDLAKGNRDQWKVQG